MSGEGKGRTSEPARPRTITTVGQSHWRTVARAAVAALVTTATAIALSLLLSQPAYARLFVCGLLSVRPVVCGVRVDRENSSRSVLLCGTVARVKQTAIVLQSFAISRSSRPSFGNTVLRVAQAPGVRGSCFSLMKERRIRPLPDPDSNLPGSPCGKKSNRKGSCDLVAKSPNQTEGPVGSFQTNQLLLWVQCKVRVCQPGEDRA